MPTRARMCMGAEILISYYEVVVPEHLRSAVETDKVDLIGGPIAEAFAAACQAGPGLY
jgi:hypothetical protein